MLGEAGHKDIICPVHLESEARYEATTEPEEETTERVIHGNSIEEMAAS